MTERTMRTHTPGPWSTGHNVYGHSQLAVMNERSVIVAEVTDWPKEDVAEANAALIAAAPELLAACEALGAFTRELLKLVSHEQIIDAKLQRRMLKVNDQAFNALAKARGEQHA